MLKLALVGKNIQHSKSPEIYNKLLGKVKYDLLDFESVNDIPSPEELFLKYDGINITSPYKEHFVNLVELKDEANVFKAINCLRKNSKIEGCNTDYLALKDILLSFKQIYQNLNVLVLGDGVMARVLLFTLRELNIKFQQKSRRLTSSFTQLNLSDEITQEKLLVINSCSREYIYKNVVPENIIFWDLNYNFPSHQEYFKNKCEYIDGHKLLLLQAEYALTFWSVKIKL
jgi:shikimate dehydrogenase